MAGKKNRGKQSKPTGKKSKPGKPGPRQTGGNGASVSGMTDMSQASCQYLATVLAPCAGNARIPDMSCLPSFLQTLDDEFTVVTNANGCAGIFLGLYNLNATASIGPNWVYENAASTDATFAYTTNSTPTGVASATAAARASRLVSACLDITYIGSDLNNSGLLSGVSNWSFDPAPLSQSAVSSGRMSSSCRVKDGMSIIYRPGDSTSFDYQPTNVTKFYGSLCFHASGLSTGASFRCRMRLNYESLPSTDTFDLSTSEVRQPVDPVGMARAITAAQDVKPVVTSSTQTSLTEAMRTAFTAAKTYGPALIRAARAASAMRMGGRMLLA